MQSVPWFRFLKEHEHEVLLPEVQMFPYIESFKEAKIHVLHHHPDSMGNKYYFCLRRKHTWVFMKNFRPEA